MGHEQGTELTVGKEDRVREYKVVQGWVCEDSKDGETERQFKTDKKERSVTRAESLFPVRIMVQFVITVQHTVV